MNYDLVSVLLVIFASVIIIVLGVVYAVLNFAKIKYPPVKEGDLTYPDPDDVDTSKIVSGYISRKEGV